MNYTELLSNVRNYTEVGSDVLTDAILNVFLSRKRQQFAIYHYLF